LAEKFSAPPQAAARIYPRFQRDAGFQNLASLG